MKIYKVIRKLFNYFFFVVILVWFFLALFRTNYNFLRTFWSINYLFIGNSQKHMQYFKCYPVATYLESYINQNTQIALLTKDGYCFFSIRYFLYPAQVYWNQVKSFNPKKKYDYAVVFSDQNKTVSNSKIIYQIKNDESTVKIFQ